MMASTTQTRYSRCENLGKTLQDTCFVGAMPEDLAKTILQKGVQGSTNRK